MEITIDSIITKKSKVNICRENADGTLTVINSKNMTVIYDLDNNTTTCVYDREAYAVKGTIYMQYIVVA